MKRLAIVGSVLMLAACASAPEPTAEGCQTDVCRQQVQRILEQERVRELQRETMEERAEREAEAAGERTVTRGVRSVEAWFWRQIEGR